MSDEWRAQQLEKLAEVEREIQRQTAQLEAELLEIKAGRVWRAVKPVRFEVPGRCGEGAFSPDGGELAVASGFEQTNFDPNGEVSVYSTQSGKCLRTWSFSAYRVVVVPTGSGEYVHAWYSQDGRPHPGDLTWCDPSGERQALATGLEINRMIGTSTGCAAVTSDGDLLIMAGAEVSRARRHIPAYNLACEPGTGMLAAVGDGLVLMNKAGRVVAKARDAVADHVVFLGPDRLVTLDDEGRATIWLHEGRRLLRAMSIDAALNVNRLIALPRHNGILAPNRFTGQASLIWVNGQALQMVEPPKRVHGHDAWGSADGRLLAVTKPFNAFLPPAPAQVEIFPPEMVLVGG